MVCQSLMEEAKKLGDGKRRLGRCHFFNDGLKMLKRVRNFGTFGVVEIHIGQQMDPRLKRLDTDGLLSRVDDIGGLAISEEQIEGVVAIDSLALHRCGSLAGGCRLKGIQT